MSIYRQDLRYVIETNIINIPRIQEQIRNAKCSPDGNR
jgi:hypothetical protein